MISPAAARAAHVTVTKVPTVQELDHPLQVSVTQSPRDLRRHGADLRELGVGEGDRRHEKSPS
jgi:hypothetical protein